VKRYIVTSARFTNLDSRVSCIFFSLLFFVLATAALALTEENVNITRDAKSGGKLVVDVDFGTIEVAPGDNDKVVVNASRKIKASSKEREEEYFAAAPITVTSDGTTVVVRARRGKDWEDGEVCNDARYSVHVPAAFDADLKTDGGAITTTNITGKVKAHTDGGDMKFSLLHGPIKADTEGGEIEVSGCEGKIDIETSGGRIQTTGGGGTLRANTAGGTIKVENFNGDAVVESAGGQLALANIRGNLQAETAGGFISAKLPSPVVGDVKLQTAAGAIEVVVPNDAALTVDAETSVGSVRSDLPVASRTGGESDGIRGTINGGGKTLLLRSGAGAISIKARGDSAQINSGKPKGT